MASNFLRNVQIDVKDTMVMLTNWQYNRNDCCPEMWSRGPRHAVCKWMALNQPKWAKYVPSAYPKQLDTSDTTGGGLIVSMYLGWGGIVATFALLVVLYHRRTQKSVRAGHPTSIATSLIGGMILFLFAAVLGQGVNDRVCTARSYLGHAGFALLLTPLLVKTHTIKRVRGAL